MFGHDRNLEVREERLGVWSRRGVKGGGGSLKSSNILYTILLEKKKFFLKRWPVGWDCN